MVEGVDSEDQQAPGEDPVALNGTPVEAETDQGAPAFHAVEVVEMSRRQQNIARQIVLQMEGKGPFGIVDGAISGHGVLRKILPMLWELPMSSEGEYDGVTVLKFLEQGVPAGADRLLLDHLCGKGEVTGGAFKHTDVGGRAVMLDLDPAVGNATQGRFPVAPNPEGVPGLGISGAPDFLCVYRLATHKSVTLQKNARRAGLYPYTLPTAPM